ncbi:unnamed protein product [Orchesella dallaii]|uniref:Uncharacterized protein n=1 Tax=Orchesella dallaii TaxID=48710 RepID=A0ABP1S7E1_9HEXA
MEKIKLSNQNSTGLPDLLLFSRIRIEYLRATPPQQMTELQTIFRNLTPIASTVTPLNTVTLESKEWKRSCDSSGEIKTNSIGVSNVILLSMLYEVTFGSGVKMPTADHDESFKQPAIQYRNTFAKYIIKQLESVDSKYTIEHGVTEGAFHEDHNREVLLERWYEIVGQLSSRHVLSEPFYRLYEIEVPCCEEDDKPRRKEIIKIFENESSFVADGTTGLVTWEASIEFLRWFSNKEVANSFVKIGSVRWILELGCGCGFLAVALTKSVPRLEKYIATDGSYRALEKAKHNVNTNFFSHLHTTLNLRRKVSFEKVDWQEESRGTFIELVDGLVNTYGLNSGILVGADIVFDPKILQDIVQLIKKFIKEKAGVVLLSCTIRNEATMTAMMQTLGILQFLIV